MFILIALLPMGFIIYELSSLNKNEEIVREIYQNQLDAILYSVNQYSDDVMSSWANRISLELQKDVDIAKDTASIRRVLSQLGAIEYLYLFDPQKKSYLLSTKNNADQSEVQLMMDDIVRRSAERVARLTRYQKSGFRKMEALEKPLVRKLVPVFFVVDHGKDNFSFAAVIIDLAYFIENILGPKMQTISQDKFVISAFHSADDSLIYSTGSINPGFVLSDEVIRQSKAEGAQKQFWLLPGYYLGISLVGATIEDLVNDRVTTSLIILSMLIVILTVGIIFLYRNIKKTLDLSQAKSEFVSNVSHEIRTPLSLISMYAETLEMERVSEEKKKEYYSVISRETARLSRIVNRILNFSQIEANKKTYKFVPVQLNDLCGEVLESYFFQLRDKGFNCEFIREEKLQPVPGDRESIAEAFINLLDNAIKYSREKKQITIQTGIENHFCFIEVKDEGIGIPRNYQQEIFEQFYRAPIGDVHNTKGSGLGLTLVKKTIEAHHGKIKVESSPGKGSAFRLYFPAKTERRNEA